MSRRPRGSTLTDRERILLSLVNRLQSTLLLAGHLYHETDFQAHDGHVYTHFAQYRGPRPGELVLCHTGLVDEWKVAWFVEWQAEEHGLALLREIGSNRLCNYGNESFLPIVGLSPNELLEGDEREFLVKVHRAFSKGGEYMYRYGGLEFPARHEARILIREAFGGFDHTQESLPFAVDMHWTKKTSTAAILRAMRAAGYGSRRFEHQPKPVDESARLETPAEPRDTDR